jgi:hypothetical protein
MKRIALLSAVGTPAIREAMARTALVAARHGIEARGFSTSDDVMDFAPDCVLVWSCQDGKLTPFPTYGVLAPPADRYTRTRRFLRNVLTYDACLTLSPSVDRWVADLAFGARKFSCPIGRFGATVQATPFEPSRQPVRLAYVGSRHGRSGLERVLTALARDEPVDLRGPAGAWEELMGLGARGSGSGSARPVPCDGRSLLAVYREAGAGLDLGRRPADPGGPPSTRLLEIVAASAVAIVVRDPAVERLFGDALLYLEPDVAPEDLARQVRENLAWIRGHRAAAAERARAAHDVFSRTFAMDGLFPGLMETHERVLVEKGYRPDPRVEHEHDLPSATYIVRTGGGRSLALLRRALDSLVAQQYPKLKAIFVLFRPMPEAEQLRLEYPQLDIRAVEDFGGLRSTAICAGMRHVETDFFGLLDDDDVLSPNHVRMLVKALQYHNGRNWRGAVRMAYSGSVEAGESAPRSEHAEYQDAHALRRSERRVMEHYRLYSSTEMSEHRWYLINSWLASRDLIDDELLDDPRIHTCEDLYVAVQLAQRTFLAFSGEVTMNHCYLDASSTVIDSHRHLADTLRGAVRHWTRLLPAESGHGGALMPLGREATEPLAPPDDDWTPAGCFLARGVGPQGAVARDRRRADDVPIELVTLPLEVEPGHHRLALCFDEFSDAGPGEGRLRVEVVADDAPGRTLVAVECGAGDLAWSGSQRRADVHFTVDGQSLCTLRVRLTGSPGVSFSTERLMVFRRAPAAVAAPPVAEAAERSRRRSRAARKGAR